MPTLGVPLRAGRVLAVLAAASARPAADAPRRSRRWLEQPCRRGIAAARRSRAARYVRRPEHRQALFSSDAANVRAAARLGREALHDLHRAAALRPERDASPPRSRHGHARPRRRAGTARCTSRAAATPRSARRLRPLRLRHRRDDAAAGRRTWSAAPGSPAIQGASSATSPTSTRCAARRPPATARSADVEGELSGLAYDRGFANSPGTAFQAAPGAVRRPAVRRRAARPRSQGRAESKIRGRHGRTPGAAPSCWPRCSSPRMATLIQLTNTPSDNFLAEMLLKGLGASFGGGGTTAGGRGGGPLRAGPSVRHPSPAQRRLRALPRRPHQPARGGHAAHGDGRQPAFVSSLAVAGQTGTLQTRCAAPCAQGRCQGKTARCTTWPTWPATAGPRDGHTLAFAFLMNGVVEPRRRPLDRGPRWRVALANYNG